MVRERGVCERGVRERGVCEREMREQEARSARHLDNFFSSKTVMP